jgi:Ion channel
MIILTIVIAGLFFQSLMWVKERLDTWIVRPPHNRKFIAAISVAIVWIQLAYAAFIWVWAILFMLLGAFDNWEESVYFSIVSFTTLGFGDVLLPKEWRLLSGMSAANGLLMFGFFTAFIVEVMRRIRREQERGWPEKD